MLIITLFQLHNYSSHLLLSIFFYEKLTKIYYLVFFTFTFQFQIYSQFEQADVLNWLGVIFCNKRVFNLSFFIFCSDWLKEIWNAVQAYKPFFFKCDSELTWGAFIFLVLAIMRIFFFSNDDETVAKVKDSVFHKWK